MILQSRPKTRNKQPIAFSQGRDMPRETLFIDSPNLSRVGEVQGAFCGCRAVYNIMQYLISL